MTQILFPTDTTGVTPASGDIILIADVSDSNNPKDCTLAELPISTSTQTAIDLKANLSGGTFSGDISVPDEVYGVAWNGSVEVPTKNALYDKIETLGSGSVATDAIWDAKGDLAVGTGANTASRLAVGANGTVLIADSAEATGVKWGAVAGSGDVVGPASSTDNAIARFDSTTGKVIQNSTVIVSDTGDISGVGELQIAELRANSSAGVDVHNNSGTQVAIFGAGGSTGSTLVGTTNIASASADYHQLSGGTGTITHTATGSSSNININEVPKGTGRFQVNGVNVPTVSSTDTLTNKRITKRVETVSSSATPSSNTDSYDITKITGLATNITSLTSGLTGTPVDGDLHMWSFTDNGTARSITPGSSFENSTVSFPSTTVISTRLDVLCEWNSATSKWRVIATA